LFLAADMNRKQKQNWLPLP